MSKGLTLQIWTMNSGVMSRVTTLISPKFVFHKEVTLVGIKEKKEVKLIERQRESQSDKEREGIMFEEVNRNEMGRLPIRSFGAFKD